MSLTKEDLRASERMESSDSGDKSILWQKKMTSEKLDYMLETQQRYFEIHRHPNWRVVSDKQIIEYEQDIAKSLKACLGNPKSWHDLPFILRPLEKIENLFAVSYFYFKVSAVGVVSREHIDVIFGPEDPEQIISESLKVQRLETPLPSPTADTALSSPLKRTSSLQYGYITYAFDAAEKSYKSQDTFKSLQALIDAGLSEDALYQKLEKDDSTLVVLLNTLKKEDLSLNDYLKLNFNKHLELKRRLKNGIISKESEDRAVFGRKTKDTDQEDLLILYNKVDRLKRISSLISEFNQVLEPKQEVLLRVRIPELTKLYEAINRKETESDFFEQEYKEYVEAEKIILELIENVDDKILLGINPVMFDSDMDDMTSTWIRNRIEEYVLTFKSREGVDSCNP